MPELSDLLPDQELVDKLGKFGIQDVGKLATEYVKNQREFSQQIRVPSEHAPTEQWESYYKRMGRPESPDGYSVPEESGSTMSKVLQALRPVAHQTGVTDKQWEQIAKGIVQGSTEQEQAKAEELKSAADAWRQQAAQRFGDRLEDVVAAGQTAVNQIAEQDPRVKEVLEQTGLGNHPAFLELMSNVANATGPESNPTGSGPEVDNAAAVIELAAEGREIVNSPEANDRFNPKYEQAMNRYYAILQKVKAAGYEGVTDKRLLPEHVSDQWRQTPRM